jgi:hypothetical protein
MVADGDLHNKKSSRITNLGEKDHFEKFTFGKIT